MSLKLVMANPVCFVLKVSLLSVKLLGFVIHQKRTMVFPSLLVIHGTLSIFYFRYCIGWPFLSSTLAMHRRIGKCLSE